MEDKVKEQLKYWKDAETDLLKDLSQRTKLSALVVIDAGNRLKTMSHNIRTLEHLMLS